MPDIDEPFNRSKTLTGLVTQWSVIALLLVAGGANKTFAGSVDVTFWIDHKRAPKALLLTSHGHPCGSVVVRRLERMPRYEPRALIQPEQVVEFDRAGNVRNRWVAPVDMSLVGISGSRVLLSDRDRTLSVDFNRTVRLHEKKVEFTPYAPASCPLQKVFGKSDYAFCAAFQDLQTGRTRRLGFEGVCT